MHPATALSSRPAATHACTGCELGSICLPGGPAPVEFAARLANLVNHPTPLSSGEHLFRTGEAFDSIYAVRKGCVKTYHLDRGGQEHVTGFVLPGELLGLDAIDARHHPGNAVALVATEICRLKFAPLLRLSQSSGSLQRNLIALMSRAIGRNQGRAADASAEQKLAQFLLDLGERYRCRGQAADDLSLAMSRRDIAGYLRLVPETVSRLFRRFCDQGLLSVDRRRVRIHDRQALEAIATEFG